jgi:hypothetical protein
MKILNPSPSHPRDGDLHAPWSPRSYARTTTSACLEPYATNSRTAWQHTALRSQEAGLGQELGGDADAHGRTAATVIAPRQ